MQVAFVGAGHVGGGDDDDGDRDAEGEGDRAEGGGRAGLEPCQVPYGEAGADGEAGREPGDRPEYGGAGEEHGDGQGDHAGDEEGGAHLLGVGIDARADRQDAVGEEGERGGEGAVDPAWHGWSSGDGVGDRHAGDGAGRPPRRDGGGGHREPHAGDRQPQRNVPRVDAMGGHRLEGRRRGQPGDQPGAGAGDRGGEPDGGAVGDHGPPEVAGGGAGGGEQAELAHAAVGEGREARPGHEAHEDHRNGGHDEHRDGGGGLLGSSRDSMNP